MEEFETNPCNHSESLICWSFNLGKYSESIVESLSEKFLGAVKALVYQMYDFGKIPNSSFHTSFFAAMVFQHLETIRVAKGQIVKLNDNSNIINSLEDWVVIAPGRCWKIYCLVTVKLCQKCSSNSQSTGTCQT